ncbi:hypothetical protein MUK42_01227 [Musa troglodytarum]|uniref:Protein yippee-like n=1 Tax=Musa troglodytarum TaxID=320322 RepID=A0A9E7JVB8_9LILI|nr:hypothetical protein MUK42_01227 [Musa troglodytarum]URD93795.1 hypothetical protein MUK42_01227 [Musa troglodytarum]URD93796.1 hypothetical protein MUK42_01227 [Musa troglodytarum]
MAAQDAGRVAAGRPGPRVYSCRNCRTHISRSDKIIAETQELHGPATLFYRAVNIYMGPEQDWRLLAGGLCRVADVYCCGCDECLGWKYTRSHDVPNMFKVGKFCIDSPKIVVE